MNERGLEEDDKAMSDEDEIEHTLGPHVSKHSHIGTTIHKHLLRNSHIRTYIVIYIYTN